MAGGTAVIALPDAGVGLYNMTGYKLSDVTPLEHSDQQLTETAVERTPAGALQLSFSLNLSSWLHDAAALPYFLWAYSAGEGLGYHSAAGAFRLDLQQQQQLRAHSSSSAASAAITASSRSSSSAAVTASSSGSSTCKLVPG
jgi:hypothetical protein